MHLFSKALIGSGVVLLVAAAAWHPLVVPQLVKLPDKVDRTDRYSGTFVTFLDQSTGATLAKPLVVPLTIDRRVATVPGSTTAHVSLLRETATVHMGGKDIVQENVYAVDRRTMQNVSDPRAWTFTPGNVVDRTGTYYLTLSMDLRPSGQDFRMWKPEAGASYGLTSTTPATGVAGGAPVVYLKGDIPTPLAVPAYEKAALKARGLPMQLTPQQAAAKLAAAGVDAGALAPVLLKTLNAAELKTVVAAMAVPLPLKYFVYGNGQVGAEPKTGGLVALSGIVDGVSVQPDMTAVAPAVAVLSNHQDVPAIASAVNTLKSLAAAAPQPVYEMRYTQTPASVLAAGSYARSQADKVSLATVTLPRTLLVLGLVSLLGGSFLILRSRRRAQPVAPLERHAVFDEQRAA